MSLVVTLEYDLLLMPAKAGEALADGGDHVIEAADIGVNVERWQFGHHHILNGDNGFSDRLGQGRSSRWSARLDDGAEMLLYIASQSSPIL